MLYCKQQDLKHKLFLYEVMNNVKDTLILRIPWTSLYSFPMSQDIRNGNSLNQPQAENREALKSHYKFKGKDIREDANILL